MKYVEILYVLYKRSRDRLGGHQASLAQLTCGRIPLGALCEWPAPARPGRTGPWPHQTAPRSGSSGPSGPRQAGTPSPDDKTRETSTRYSRQQEQPEVVTWPPGQQEMHLVCVWRPPQITQTQTDFYFIFYSHP